MSPKCILGARRVYHRCPVSSGYTWNIWVEHVDNLSAPPSLFPLILSFSLWLHSNSFLPFFKKVFSTFFFLPFLIQLVFLDCQRTIAVICIDELRSWMCWSIRCVWMWSSHYSHLDTCLFVWLCVWYKIFVRSRSLDTHQEEGRLWFWQDCREHKRLHAHTNIPPDTFRRIKTFFMVLSLFYLLLILLKSKHRGCTFGTVLAFLWSCLFTWSFFFSHPCGSDCEIWNKGKAEDE